MTQIINVLLFLVQSFHYLFWPYSTVAMKHQRWDSLVWETVGGLNLSRWLNLLAPLPRLLTKDLPSCVLCLPPKDRTLRKSICCLNTHFAIWWTGTLWRWSFWGVLGVWCESIVGKVIKERVKKEDSNLRHAEKCSKAIGSSSYGETRWH